MDQSTLYRLANIKGVYNNSIKLLENPTPLEGAIALVLLDNSLEAMLKLVLDEADGNPKRDPSFPMLLECALQVEKLKDLKTYKTALMGLHGARNGFQHQGIVPDISAVLNEYKPFAENFLQVVSKQKFGINWAEVSLSLLIKNGEIGAIIKKAEQAFSAGDYLSTTAYLIYAFESTKAFARFYISGSGLSLIRKKMEKYRKDNPIVQYITTLDEEIETFKLGLNYKDFRYYLDVAQLAGVKGILDEIPSTNEEAAIREFKLKIESAKILTDNSLKTWCVCVNDFVLTFILRTEANPRITIALLQQFMKGAIEGLEKVSKQGKKATDLLNKS